MNREKTAEKKSVSRRSNIACQKQQTVIYLDICSYVFFLQHFRVEREHKSVRKNYSKAKARYQAFDPFLHARFFRLKIRAWRGHQCLTLELYGCDSCEYNFLENIKLSISPAVKTCKHRVMNQLGRLLSTKEAFFHCRPYDVTPGNCFFFF